MTKCLIFVLSFPFSWCTCSNETWSDVWVYANCHSIVCSCVFIAIENLKSIYILHMRLYFSFLRLMLMHIKMKWNSREAYFFSLTPFFMTRLGYWAQTYMVLKTKLVVNPLSWLRVRWNKGHFKVKLSLLMFLMQQVSLWFHGFTVDIMCRRINSAGVRSSK